MPITPLANGMSFGKFRKFLSYEHKNIYFWEKMAEKIKVKVAYPPSRILDFLSTHCRFSSFACAKIKAITHVIIVSAPVQLGLGLGLGLDKNVQAREM